MEQKFKMKNILQMDVKELFKKNKATHSKQTSKKKKVEKVYKKDIVVFDIGSKETKIVVGKQVKNKIEVAKAISTATPKDCILDGKVINEAVLASTLQSCLAKHNIRTKYAIITTNSSQVINREMVINKVEDDEMETVIRYELQQYLPINLNDYLIRYMLIGEFEENEEVKSKLYVIAYPDRVAKGYYSLLKKMDLKPLGLETTYVSLNKLLDLSKSMNSHAVSPQDTIAILNVGATTVEVNVYRAKKIDLTRIIKIGSNQIDALLAQRHEIPLTSSHVLKTKANLMTDDTAEVMTMKEGVNQIVFEVDRILQFYRHKNFTHIKQVYLIGGGASLQGIDSYMMNQFNSLPNIKAEDHFTVEALQHSDVVQFKGNLKVPLSEYANAIGALVRG